MSTKVILVTGGNSRLGVVVCKYLVKAGHTVYAGIHTKSEHVEAIDGVNIVSLNVTNTSDCVHAIEKIVKREGRIDALVNVAGVTISGAVDEATPESFLKLLDINVVSHLRLNTTAFSIMSKQKSRGRIINITSLSGLVALPNFGIYSASKFAAEALGETMHYEFKSRGVFVTNITPGAIHFPSTQSLALKHTTLREKYPILKLILRMSTPEKIAHAVADLINSERNPRRVLLGIDAFIVYNLYRFTPQFLFSKIVARYLSKS